MRAAGPVVDPLPCSACGRLLDPLRAGHVAIFDERLHYFCDRDGCRAEYLAPFGDEPSRAVTPARKESPPRKEAGPIVAAHAPQSPEEDLPDPVPLDDDPALIEPIEHSPEFGDVARSEPADPREVGALLLLLGVVAGSLAVVLGISGGGRLVLLARLVLVGVANAVLVARAVTTERGPTDPHAAPVLAAPVASLLVGLWAVLRASPVLASEAVSLAGAIATVSAVGAWLLESARRGVEAERAWVEHALDGPARRIHPGGAIDEGVSDLHPGEHVLVEEGEDVPCDLMILDGDAEVLPWLGANSAVRRRAGDAVVGGSHVLRGRLVGTTTAARLDQAFARVVLDPRRRLDALAPVARAARSLVERWSVVASLAAALLAYAITRQGIDAAMTAVAVQAGLGSMLTAVLPSVYVGRGVLLSQRRGITYKSADAWERAAHASIAVFCARGTLLMGEPEVAEIEALGASLGVTDVLSLAAGCARAEDTPTARAILRATKARGVKPDAVRNPNLHAGLGVVAVTSGGEELVVGSRTHLLEQRVGIASAERRMGELTNLGRSIVLVALGGRLVGLVSLQDGIRPGARAAVQHLLDEEIEPVLLSGDSRETCDAIARSLDIEHVRAEVPPQDRAEEVKRLLEGGDHVAVVGHPRMEEAALLAGHVSVALSSAGQASTEYDIALASDDLRDAALSIAVARRTRTEARLGFGLTALPPLLGVLVVALGVLPPAFVPIASFLGGVMGVVHFRAGDRARR